MNPNQTLSEQIAASDARRESVDGMTERIFDAATKGIVTEPCGCRFNWNDKFYESRCAEHEAEAMELETEREYYEISEAA